MIQWLLVENRNEKVKGGEIKDNLFKTLNVYRLMIIKRTEKYTNGQFTNKTQMFKRYENYLSSLISVFIF